MELTVRNGSSLKLHIPNAHVSSYKPKVYWKDDGFEEVLYTIQDDKQQGSSTLTSTCRGGIGFVLTDSTKSTNSDWAVQDVDSDSIDALQVELSCTRGNLEMTYVVSLYPVSMATAVIVKNKGPKAVSLNSAILSHFRFKTRKGSGIQGLEGSSYCTHPPLPSPFEILSPTEATKADPNPPSGGFFFNFGWEPEKPAGVWSVQDVPITVMRHKMSRVYSAPPEERAQNQFHRTAPSKYEIIDQGRELFFRVIRMGYEEIYLSSPGSFSDRYGKDYFVCTGPASMLAPVTLNPGQDWRGAQIIEHDNLS